MLALARKTWRIFDCAMMVVTIGACLILAAMLVITAFGCQFVVIESGSMVPTIQVGGIVVIKKVPPTTVHSGQIVTFRDALIRNQLVTHRVVSTVRDGNIVHFTTKGDANKVPEHWLVPVRGEVGRELAILPVGGRWVTYLSTDTAKLVIIWTLGAWIMSAVLRWVWRLPRLQKHSAPANGPPENSLSTSYRNSILGPPPWEMPDSLSVKLLWQRNPGESGIPPWESGHRAYVMETETHFQRSESEFEEHEIVDQNVGDALTGPGLRG